MTKSKGNKKGGVMYPMYINSHSAVQTAPRDVEERVKVARVFQESSAWRQMKFAAVRFGVEAILRSAYCG